MSHGFGLGTIPTRGGSRIIASTIHDIPVEQATPETVAPFGQLLGIHEQAKPLPVAFYYDGNGSVSAPVAFESDEKTMLALAAWAAARCGPNGWSAVSNIRRPSFRLRESRSSLSSLHRLRTTCRISGRSRPSCSTARPALRCKAEPGREIPFALVDQSKIPVILCREATQNLMPGHVVDGEAYGPDLDKKNLAARTGVTVQVRM